MLVPNLPLASFQRELVDLCESFKTRYIFVHVMNYYVFNNMAAYENSLLCILFGFLLLSVLFCNDIYQGVLSKDFIYGCLVRNRELDPSMGDNFKCLYLNVRYHYRGKQFSRNFKVAIPISKTTGHRIITLALPHSLFSMDLPVSMDIHCNPGALTICTKNPVIPGRIQMKRFIPVEMFRKNVTPFEVLPFSRFHQKGLKFFVLFVWLTSARGPLEAKVICFNPGPLVIWCFANCRTLTIRLFGNVFISQFHFSETFYRNFLTNGKRSRS